MEAREVSGSDMGVRFSWLSVQLVRQRHWASGPAPGMRTVKDPEVSVESKEIRFSGKHKMGPRYLSAYCRKDNRRYIQMWRGNVIKEVRLLTQATLETAMTLSLGRMCSEKRAKHQGIGNQEAKQAGLRILSFIHLF